MSYDLAVWEGDRPADNAVALATLKALRERYTGEGRTPATPRIQAYVEALLERWIDLTEDERSPWSTGPLIREASGPIVYFPMVYSRCEEVSAGAARIAAEHGLVCFDPQLGLLRPAPEELQAGPSTGQ
ncbi:hypothetical protein D7147_05245 [Micromonospora musae]|uniref:Uncharacterized protein n=1 Tax=Micromonospora musae TaxID=1894970 RepID=A0A3A9YGQ7_9ACTN|nr:hypothetical protein [Micromonospora musae]RKN22123.1 hypothetical protein D7147_05245 [Micromonospora musae]RKN33884.1 hypothetical protein D7044_09215 [Micromonospora musae]